MGLSHLLICCILSPSWTTEIETFMVVPASPRPHFRSGGIGVFLGIPAQLRNRASLEVRGEVACGLGVKSLLHWLRSCGCCCRRLVEGAEDGVLGPWLSRQQVKQGHTQGDRRKICTDNNITCKTSTWGSLGFFLSSYFLFVPSNFFFFL